MKHAASDSNLVALLQRDVHESPTIREKRRKSAGSTEAVRVYVRVRPLTPEELLDGTGESWKVDKNSLTYFPTSSTDSENKISLGPKFVFDHLGGADTVTGDIYTEMVDPIVSSFVGGVNGTIMAYGQTSSGKTHTMSGTEHCPGINSLSISALFDYLENVADRSFILRVSYFEIYNEAILDLLHSPKQVPHKLLVRESTVRGIFVENLTEVVAMTKDTVTRALQLGEENRHVGQTSLNRDSSRSHTILSLSLESRSKVSLQSHTPRTPRDRAQVTVSVLNLVDLAGSERASAHVHNDTDGLSNFPTSKEGGFINRSLFHLGTVIEKLSTLKNVEKRHIPYRNSTLTRILQPSLGGNARTAIICNVAPARVCMSDTMGTLQFAMLACTIKNRVHVNQISNGDYYHIRHSAARPKQRRQTISGKLSNKESKNIQRLMNGTSLPDLLSTLADGRHSARRPQSTGGRTLRRGHTPRSPKNNRRFTFDFSDLQNSQFVQKSLDSMINLSKSELVPDLFNTQLSDKKSNLEQTRRKCSDLQNQNERLTIELTECREIIAKLRISMQSSSETDRKCETCSSCGLHKVKKELAEKNRLLQLSDQEVIRLRAEHADLASQLCFSKKLLGLKMSDSHLPTRSPKRRPHSFSFAPRKINIIKQPENSSDKSIKVSVAEISEDYMKINEQGNDD
eukprot:173777_1